MNCTRTAWAFLALLLSATGVVEGAPSRQDLKSSWVDVSSGGLFGEVGGKPELRLTLRSKATQAAWVQVRIAAPSPNSECVLTKAITPGEEVAYPCIQERIVPDADYPIFVTVYRDEALTDQADTAQTAMRFSKRDANTFTAYLAAPDLPATFNDVNLSEKLNLGTALFGGLGSGSGTLVVRETGLHYSIKDKVTEIPLSQIRGVKIRSFANDETKSWVTIEYTDGDTVRTIGFQGSLFRGGGPRVFEMHKAISYVWSKYAKVLPAN
jgi:hypothetical protein